MSTEATHLTLIRVARVLWRRAWIIALCTLVAGAVAFVVSRSQTKQYTATAALLFQDSTLQQEASGLPATPQGNTPSVSATNVSLVSLGRTAAATAKALGGGLTPQAVHAAVSVSAVGQTNLADVSATLPNPALAARVANAFAEQFIRSSRAVQRQTIAAGLRLVEQQIVGMSKAQLATVDGQALVSRAESLKVLSALQTGGAQLVQPAGIPGSPSSPKTKRNTGLGLFLGLLIGLGLVLLLERLDNRIRDVHELEQIYGATVLGQIPESAGLSLPQHHHEGERGIVLSPDAEGFRLLRAHLRYFNVDRELHTLQVTSLQPGDGKTTIAWNLAATTASMGTKTLLIEADLRRPRLSSVLGLAASPGVAQVLVNDVGPMEATQHLSVAGYMTKYAPRTELDVLVAGAVPPNPAELIDSEAMRDLLQWAAQSYELVIIDAPPPGLVSDAVTLLAAADGVLIVSRMDRHSRDQVRRLARDLRSIDAHVLGLVINGFERPSGYGYGYGYSSKGPESAGRRAIWKPVSWRRNRDHEGPRSRPSEPSKVDDEHRGSPPNGDSTEAVDRDEIGVSSRTD